MFLSWASAAAGVLVLELAGARPARALGAGVFSVGGDVVADTHMLFIAVGRERTEVVEQVTVPRATSDFGLLIPVGAEPTVDAQPIPVDALQALDARTAPRVLVQHTGACTRSVSVTTADVMSRAPAPLAMVEPLGVPGANRDFARAWIVMSAFVLTPEARAVLDEYSGPGRAFVGVRRTDARADGGPSTLGVHFSVPGDARELSLRLIGLGAAPAVAFTILVVAPAASAPAPPFAGLTLDQIDRASLGSQGYAPAVEQAAVTHGGRTFVIELVTPVVPELLPPPLERLTDAGQPLVLTRLSAVLARDALTEDARLDGAGPSQVPTSITLAALRAPSALTVAGGLVVVAFRRRSRRARAPQRQARAAPR